MSLYRVIITIAEMKSGSTTFRKIQTEEKVMAQFESLNEAKEFVAVVTQMFNKKVGE